MLCKRVQTLDSNVQNSQNCLIHYARAYMRIMRADTCAHTYIKFVKNRTVHLKSRATLWKETEVASAPQFHGVIPAAGCVPREGKAK